jgi:hypothetical protein
MSILSKLPIAPAKSRDVIVLNSTPATEAAAAWIASKHDEQSATAGLEMCAAAVIPLARAEYFRANVGRPKPCGSVEIVSPAGTVLASFASVWTAKGGLDLLPPEVKRPKFAIRINGDAIPDDRQEPFVDGLMLLARTLGCPDAVTATGGMAPIPTFTEVRHRLLSPAQNEAVEAAGLGTRVTLRIR